MTVTGRIIEIGDLKHLADTPAPFAKSGIVLLIPREQLAEMKENLLYEKVKIELVKE